MAALRKQIIDVQAADGLHQKFDQRRLPTGKSASAVNLVKTKQGSLQKRLGLKPLNKNNIYNGGVAGGTIPMSTGVTLGTWDIDGEDNLFAIGRGSWTPAGSTPTFLETYSDDLGGWVIRGPVPDVSVTVDALAANCPGIASNVASAITGDYLVVAWRAWAPALSIDQIWWGAIQLSTGQIIQPAQVLDNKPLVTYIRLFTVKTAGSNTVVVVYSQFGDHHIYAQNTTEAILSSANTSVWNSGGGAVTLKNSGVNIVNNAGAGANGGPMDARAISGDLVNWMLMYQTGAADGSTAAVVLQKFGASSLVNTTAPVSIGVPNTNNYSALGFRSDLTGINQTGACAMSGNQQPNILYASTLTTNALALVGAAITLYTCTSTTPHAGTTYYEKYATWLDVSYCGNTGQTTGHTWTCSHTPGGWDDTQTYNGAVWNPRGAIVGGNPPPAQNATGRVTDNNAGTPGSVTLGLPDVNNAAQIIQNQFFWNALGSVTAGYSSTSGANAIRTYGVTLASRGLEANGIVYYNGWVPSFTQGKFLTFALDQAQNASYVGTTAPMRPVATLQTNTCLADPGVGPSGQLSNPLPPTVPGPNQWNGASEWNSLGDNYNSYATAYVSSSLGQRLDPAYGVLQTAPVQGYQSAQYGSLTAIGGALPVQFDGQNVFEQAFLWTGESITVTTGSTTSHGPHWKADGDSYSWIFTWEHFDAQGNFHISARSTPVTIVCEKGTDYTQLSNSAAAPVGIYSPTFTIPTLETLRQWPTGPAHSLLNCAIPPGSPVTLGVYRNVLGSQEYFRVNDVDFNQYNAPSATVVPNAFGQATVTFTDTIDDGKAGSLGGIGSGAVPGLQDGTHPLLYGDGSNGAPGSLDNGAPDATTITIRHKERIFIASGNQVCFTKQRGAQQGPGYNTQVNAFYVGGDDPITGMASMDDKLVILKQNQAYYISGDGPADDGSGSSFSPPQPIPTDSGCITPYSVKSTPEGVYYMSSAGLRLVDRGLVVRYVGGPVEDELDQFSTVSSTTLYPQNNRLMVCVNTSDAPLGLSTQLFGEILVRDYALDAWTTAVVNNGVDFPNVGFVSAAVASAPQTYHILFPSTVQRLTPTIHFLDCTGQVWRERGPLDSDAYYDNATYVSWTWKTPMIKNEDQGRMRIWDIILIGQSLSPHGATMKVGIDYGGFGGIGTAASGRTWVWNSTTVPSITSGGVQLTPLTQLRYYDGRMGESFQVQVQDISDTASTDGQGLEVLGLTVSTGKYEGPYKLPPGGTQ